MRLSVVAGRYGQGLRGITAVSGSVHRPRGLELAQAVKIRGLLVWLQPIIVSFQRLEILAERDTGRVKSELAAIGENYASGEGLGFLGTLGVTAFFLSVTPSIMAFNPAHARYCPSSIGRAG